MHSKFESAISLFQSGQLNKANNICSEILKDEPNNFEILHLLGIISFQEKKYDLSVEYIKKALKINPEQAEANNNLGIALKELKKFEKASESFNKAIKIDSNFAEAYNNLGIVLKELNQIDSAIDNWKKSIKIKPDYVHAYNNLGNALLEQKNPKSAIDYYDKAILIDSKFYEAYFNHGNALQELGLFEDAIKSYEKAINIKSDYAEAYYYKGNSLREIKLIEKAIENYEKAFKINPNLNNLFGSLVFAKHCLCDWKFYEKDLEILEKEILKNKNISKPFTILSIFDSSPLQRISAEINVKDKFQNTKSLGPILKREPSKKIRLGYYSSDFRNHAMSYLLAGLFELHDKSKFELIAFSLGPEKKDEMTERIASTFDKFIETNSKTDKEITKLSRDLKIDIAIDLMGFTKSNRFGIFVERCAPIQINYLGYPGTSGSNCIDYIIADKILIPKENQIYYSEKIIYLPDTYQVRDSSQKISNKIFKREDFDLPKNSFVFCCFNKHYKFTPSVFEIWMRLLKKVNNSVLWMLDDNNKTSENLKNEAIKKGINSNRLIFAKRLPVDEHLSRHKLADLFIDTFPYCAHTTCSDALWSCLPIVTRMGQSFESRVAGSILSAIDLSELISHTEKEYEDLALKLATNSEKLSEIRNKLKINRNTKPLFNTSLYTKNIESAYKTIYEKYLNKLPIENIEI